MKCPIDGGNLLPWNKPPSMRPWFCPHACHGGNGAFWTGDQLERANAMSSDLEEMLPMLLDGSMSIADGAVILARRSNASVPEMQRMLEARVRMAHVYDEWKSANTVDSTTSGGVTSSRVNDASHVPPEAFMAALTERGLTKKQAAEAIGRSASRVHELTVRDGGKQHLYDSFVENLDAYLRRVADGEASSGDSKPSDK